MPYLEHVRYGNSEVAAAAMRRKGKAEATYRFATFAELFCWHLKNNTRPAATARQRSWSTKSFALAIHVSERQVRNWKRGFSLPLDKNYEAIERAFFGEDPSSDAYWDEFRVIFEREKNARQAPLPPSVLRQTPGVGITKRENLLDHLRASLIDGTAFRGRLILFGGVASSLCAPEIADGACKLLEAKREAHLFVCYESGAAAKARALTINPKRLTGDKGLSTGAIKRMKEKEKLVLAFKRRMMKNLGHTTIRDRAHFIPLTMSVTAYVIVRDGDVHMTPPLSDRSSKTMTFSLDDKQHKEEVREVYHFMLFHLEGAKPSADVDALTNMLQAMVKVETAS